MTRESDRRIQSCYSSPRALCWLASFCLLGVISTGQAVQALAADQTVESPDTGSRCFVVEIYLRAEQQDSRDATSALERFSKSRRGLLIAKRDISTSDENLKRLRLVAQHYGVDATATPVIYGCNRIIAGYPSHDEFVRQLKQMLRMEVFVRYGCPRCARAKTFLSDFSPRYPGLELVYRDIKSDPQALVDMNQLVTQHRTQAASVPVIHLCNRLIIGFSNAASTEQRLQQTLQMWTVPCKKEKRAASSAAASDHSTSIPLPSRTYASANPARAWQAVAVVRPEVNLGYLLTVHRSDLGDGDVGEEDKDHFEEDVALPLPPPVAENETNTDYELPESSAWHPQPIADDPPSVQLPVFGELSVEHIGLPALTIAMGLVDGFNPCAMWVLLFLLSLLVNLKDRWRILVIAGTFVLVSGLAYFAFMAAWLNVFLFIGYLRPIQIALGLIAVAVGSIHIKDFFALHRGISLSIPEAAKPGIYARTRQIITAENILGALVGATILAVMVNIVELLCTAGLPALYTEILTMQGLTVWQNYTYLGLYNVCYMFDDALMVALVVITLGKRKLQETQGRWLKLVSGAVIAILGVIMIFKPDILF